ncbi:major facilitator superfamily domain-containing protein [Aspergillus minisclerotigenes]|uniref:Major facilitator superfamily domain-containing protein n=1 Tax=Aspergillus minisclerotigenes TaxID=656917 RepID=A0A5N6J5E0_9EURO|nr:major facilitator superfamily domain-containing protein [Aspergillus minisclerotigenes]
MADTESNACQHAINEHATENVTQSKPQKTIRSAILDIVEKTRADPCEHYHDAKYPEGGLRAWLVVLGSWCAMVPSMGLLNTIGVLHAWTADHQLAQYSSSSLGWIFGAFSFFLYFGGAQVGPIFDSRGVLPVVLPGSIGIVLSVFFFSASTEYYQIFLSFSVLGGISSCCLFTPAISAVGHWFDVRRGLATGIACTAGGLGGVFFPLIILYIGPTLGFAWAMRIIGIISFVLCALACLLLKTRLPPNQQAGMAIDLKALLEPKYALTTLAVWLVEFAVFIPYTYIVSYGLYAGLEQSMAYKLSVFLNAGAIPGRAFPGILADRMGRFNVMTTTAVICAICTLALWYKAGTNEGAIIAYAVLFGFWSGAAISLTPVCISQVCRTEDYGKRNGTTFTLVSVGTLIGIPLAGAIQESNGGEYWGLIIFGGVLYLASAVAFAVARGVAGGWGWKVKF